jgi:hypothetical protein
MPEHREMGFSRDALRAKQLWRVLPTHAIGAKMCDMKPNAGLKVLVSLLALAGALAFVPEAVAEEGASASVPPSSASAPAASAPAASAASPAAAPAPGAPATASPGTPTPPEAVEPEKPAVDLAPGPPVDLDELKDKLKVESEILEQSVSEAKERDFNSKVRLRAFRDTVLTHIEPPGGARLVVVHRNEMAGAFTLIGIAYALDGAPSFSQLDQSGALDERGQITVFNAKVVPGEHQLAVQYDLVGNPMGFFGYLRDLKLTLRRTYNFKVEPKRETKLIGKLSTNNGVAVLYEKRPNIGFETIVSDLRASDKTETARVEQTAAALTGDKSLGTFAPSNAEKGGQTPPPAPEK